MLVDPVTGKSVPLKRETAWSRHFYDPDTRGSYAISRFSDGSASITLAELVSGWSGWSEADRVDFAQNCSWLRGQADFPDMLRFLIDAGDPLVWSSLASSVASVLSTDEAFTLLSRALDQTPLQERANLIQALGSTRHPDARRKVEAVLDELRRDGVTLWKDESFINWFAYTATFCVKYLIELGAPASDFEAFVRALSRHPCRQNRDTCSRRLGEAYSWLQVPEDEPP
jgi:hypothetical protein